MFYLTLIRILLQRAARPALQLILLVIFLFFFGLPAIETYQKKEVIVVEHKKDSDGISFPAITLTAWVQEETKKCYHTNQSAEATEKCIEDNSLTTSDIFKGIIRGFGTQVPLNVSKDMWTEDSTNYWTGRYYTLNLPLTIGPNDFTDQIYILLSNSSLHYQIFIHDPKFFFYSDNPGFPMETRSFSTISSFNHFYRISLIEMNELDVPWDRCYTGQDFNFNECVKENIAKKVVLKYVLESILIPFCL